MVHWERGGIIGVRLTVAQTPELNRTCGGAEGQRSDWSPPGAQLLGRGWRPGLDISTAIHSNTVFTKVFPSPINVA